MRYILQRAALLCIAVASLGMGSGHNHELCEGFVPENDLRIPVGHNYRMRVPGDVRGGLTEAEFNAVIDRFERLYTDEFSRLGGRLRVNRNWSDGTVNASANRSGSTWHINMYGGLARHPAITIEGFALVICHEGGHHIGGAPKISNWFSSWATNEGGSDYFATLKCLRRFFAEDDNETIIANANIDPHARTLCEQEFQTRADQLLCMRSSMAGTSTAFLFMDLRKETTQPRFDTPDQNQVSQTFNNHPATQCRMDTYFAGATCRVDHTIPVSNTDAREGACNEPNDPVGVRPRCWFKP